MRQILYQMRQKFIQKCIRIFITKCDSYYKMRRLSQNATFIKNCESTENPEFNACYTYFYIAGKITQI